VCRESIFQRFGAAIGGFHFHLIAKRRDIFGKGDVISVSLHIQTEFIGGCKGKGVAVFFIKSEHNFSPVFYCSFSLFERKRTKKKQTNLRGLIADWLFIRSARFIFGYFPPNRRVRILLWKF
jgi:hypothetical protein